jgi:acetyl-CoA C-acetyltransferase
VINAAMMVQTGVADVVLAGGADSMSRVEFYTTDMRRGSRLGSVTLHDRLVRARATVSPDRRFGPISGMIETAENLAREYGISREAQDEYALLSHRRAVAATTAGKLAEEIVPVSVPQRRGPPVLHAADEGPRADTSLESLAKLQPIQRDGTVTAGNASSQNDAAAACLVVAAERLEELELEPMAFFRGWAVAGCHPATMGIGPVPAVRKLFERTGLGWDDIELVELNEAFAAQVLAVLHEWRRQGFDHDDRLNVNGSGISLGHPIAATGARILTTLLYEMERQDARWGLETMCIGGGQGLAAVFERV